MKPKECCITNIVFGIFQMINYVIQKIELKLIICVWCGVWCGVVCGVVWRDMVWCVVLCGVVWCCVVWCGVVWCGVVRCDVCGEVR